MRLGENAFTFQCKKEDKEGFQISHCYWSFSSDIMAVKGLNALAPAENLISSGGMNAAILS